MVILQYNRNMLAHHIGRLPDSVYHRGKKLAGVISCHRGKELAGVITFCILKWQKSGG